MSRKSVLYLTRPSLESARQYLSKSDKVMADIISRVGRCDLLQQRPDPLRALVRAVIGQQLSARAAGSIFLRVHQCLGDDTIDWPAQLVRKDLAELRALGLSSAKAGCIKRIGEAVSEGRVDFQQLEKEEDEIVIEHLTEIKGIGTWTAEMFLIFALHRADVFSIRDQGLKAAIKQAYSIVQPTEIAIQTIAQRWRPFRTVASWYLWRSLDSTT